MDRFLDIYVGWPGRVHDSQVFSNSSLNKRGQTGVLLPDWKEQFAGKDVRLVILGDPAYPLLSWLMKAFPNNGHLSTEKKRFNYRLSKVRAVVQHAYGRLKGRWRCLLKRLDVDVHDVPELVAACCMLHNICEVHGDGFDEQWMEGVEESTRDDCSAAVTTVQLEDNATETRDAL